MLWVGGDSWLLGVKTPTLAFRHSCPHGAVTFTFFYFLIFIEVLLVKQRGSLSWSPWGALEYEQYHQVKPKSHSLFLIPNHGNPTHPLRFLVLGQMNLYDQLRILVLLSIKFEFLI